MRCSSARPPRATAGSPTTIRPRASPACGPRCAASPRRRAAIPTELISTNQLPICIGPRAKIEAPMKHWLQTEWDYASWSESTMESAIMGSVEECVEQLGPHIEAGVDRIIFVLQVRDRAGGGGCPGNHPTAQKRRRKLRPRACSAWSTPNLGSTVTVSPTSEQIAADLRRFARRSQQREMPMTLILSRHCSPHSECPLLAASA